jgi:hypothetical protein
MALIAHEVLVVLGKALQRLGEQLADGTLSTQEQQELISQIISELMREYID